MHIFYAAANQMLPHSSLITTPIPHSFPSISAASVFILNLPFAGGFHIHWIIRWLSIKICVSLPFVFLVVIPRCRNLLNHTPEPHPAVYISAAVSCRPPPLTRTQPSRHREPPAQAARLYRATTLPPEPPPYGDIKGNEARKSTRHADNVLRPKLRILTMNIYSFKQDIDELIGEFAQDESTTLADMKRVWLSKKFSYIYEASPSTNLAFFMQSLYAHSIGYMGGTASLSHRLGGLYCLYCLYETQPFKPPFKIYLSVGEVKKLRILVADAKANNIKVVPALVRRMLDRNMFLFGSVDLMEGSVAETVNQLQQLQDARIKVAYEKLFQSTSIDNYVHMDLGMEVDLEKLKKMSSEYARAKNVAVKEASNILDVQNIKHISEDKELIGDVVEKIANDWKDQREKFGEQTGLGEDDGYDQELERLLLEQQQDDDDDYDDDGECDQE